MLRRRHGVGGDKSRRRIPALVQAKRVHRGVYDIAGAGSFLGQFTDEIDGDVIVEFCSGGAKNYGYLTKKGKVECKVRGFSLKYETKQVLNYQTMKENILRELDDPLEKARRMAITIPDFFQRSSDQENQAYGA